MNKYTIAIKASLPQLLFGIAGALATCDHPHVFEVDKENMQVHTTQNGVECLIEQGVKL